MEYENEDEIHGKRELSKWDNVRNPDLMPEISTHGAEHPTPEQLMIREAAKHLSPNRRKVWDMLNYDRMTHEEIAARLKISQQAVSSQVKTIEKQLTKWIQEHKEVYNMLSGL